MGEGKKFHGIIPPLVTWFDEHGRFDKEANLALVDNLIENGVHGLLLLGSTGEFSLLTPQERMQYAENMLDHIRSRVPVLVGIGSTSFDVTCKLAKHAEACGANGVLVMAPYYWNHTEHTLYRYFACLAEKISLPLFLYNIPQLVGQPLSVDLVARLAADYPQIAGIKETVNDLGEIRKKVMRVKTIRPDFLVFSAFDEHLLPGLELGADGAVNGTSLFDPALSVALYKHFLQKNFQKAIILQQELNRRMSVYELTKPMYLGLKAAVRRRYGWKGTGNRFPYEQEDSDLNEKIVRLFAEWEEN